MREEADLRGRRAGGDAEGEKASGEREERGGGRGLLSLSPSRPDSAWAALGRPQAPPWGARAERCSARAREGRRMRGRPQP